MPEYLFTTHAKERLALRHIPESMAISVLQHPDKTYPGKKEGTVKFVRRIQGRELQLVAIFLADQQRWLVISAWVRGEDDPVPVVWQLLSLPFKLSWWLLKKVGKFVMSLLTKHN